MELLDLPITSVHTSSSHTKKNPSRRTCTRATTTIFPNCMVFTSVFLDYKHQSHIVRLKNQYLECAWWKTQHLCK